MKVYLCLYIGQTEDILSLNVLCSVTLHHAVCRVEPRSPLPAPSLSSEVQFGLLCLFPNGPTAAALRASVPAQHPRSLVSAGLRSRPPPTPTPPHPNKKGCAPPAPAVSGRLHQARQPLPRQRLALKDPEEEEKHTATDDATGRPSTLPHGAQVQLVVECGCVG